LARISAPYFNFTIDLAGFTLVTSDFFGAVAAAAGGGLVFATPLRCSKNELGGLLGLTIVFAAACFGLGLETAPAEGFPGTVAVPRAGASLLFDGAAAAASVSSALRATTDFPACAELLWEEVDATGDGAFVSGAREAALSFGSVLPFGESAVC
jgi:hypothetical protein